MTQFAQVIRVADGTIFETKKEAEDYLRRPAITAALKSLVGDNVQLTDWLIANQEKVEVAFETGTIRRVTKADAKKLEAALAAIVEANDPKAKFLVDNVAAVRESFRWPTVKRMTDDEKAHAARNGLLAATENNESLVAFILENKEAILNAYEAGKVKREVSTKATEALAAYRAKKAEEKALAAPATDEAASTAQ